MAVDPPIARLTGADERMTSIPIRLSVRVRLVIWPVLRSSRLCCARRAEGGMGLEWGTQDRIGSSKALPDQIGADVARLL